MPDNTPYLDSSVVGFDHQDALDARVDTYRRLAPIMNMQDAPAIDASIANNLRNVADGPSSLVDNAPKINLDLALMSTDPVIKQNAIQTLRNQTNQTPEYKFDIGKAIETPTDNPNYEKFVGKEFGFSAIRDNEDFYYKNQYMNHGWFTRNLILNPSKFIARVVPQAVMKFGEGLGYVGSMITDIGSNNYWADVADNGMSKWLMNKEQWWKDRVIPVFHEAGFDQKGFFSKLTDWSFWNDQISDTVAFMASAAIPGSIIGKLGTVAGAVGEAGEAITEANAFGRVFGSAAKLGSFANKAGALAGNVGMGSWAELTSWTFNTASESAMEANQVYTEMMNRWKTGVATGDPKYADISEEDMRKRAGKLAASEIGNNFMILGISNAFENTLFFKPFKETPKGEMIPNITLDESTNFMAKSKVLSSLDKSGFWNNVVNPLSRAGYYGRRASLGFVMEGLWEENAQLAIQRVNQGDTGNRGFWAQYFKQIGDAFSGKDEEALESIGLGGLVGIGATTFFEGIMPRISSVTSGHEVKSERRESIETLRNVIESTKNARNSLFSTTDIYQRDPETNNIVFKDNEPQIDTEKLAAKAKALEEVYGTLSIGTKNDYFNSVPVEFETKKAVAAYIMSLRQSGIGNITDRMRGMSRESAALFGLDPTNINEKSYDLEKLAGRLETIANDAVSMSKGTQPDGVEDMKFHQAANNRLNRVYNYNSQNEILTGFIQSDQAKLLDSLNKFRNVSNSTIAQYPVDAYNTLRMKLQINQGVIDGEGYKKSMSPLEQQYHNDRAVDLQQQMDSLKQASAEDINNARTTEKGWLVPVITDEKGNKREVKFNTKAIDLQRRIANHEEVVSKNSYLSNLLSQDEWYDNYQQLMDTPEMQELKKGMDAMNNSLKPKEVFSKYREENKGDFQALTRLAAKTLYSTDKEYSPEELQLQSNYPELFEKLLQELGNVAETQRVINLNRRMTALKAQQDVIKGILSKEQGELEEGLTELQILKEELSMPANGKKSNQTRIGKAITSLEKKIQDVLEPILYNESERLKALNSQVTLIESEIQEGSFQKLYDDVATMRNELVENQKKFVETKSLFDKVVELIDFLKTMGRKLFGAGWLKNNKFAVSDGIEYVSETNKALAEKDMLKKALDDIQNLQTKLSATYREGSKQLSDTLQDIDNYFANKYLDTTKRTVVAQTASEKRDPEEKTITNALTADKGIFPGSDDTGGETFDPESGFDGDSYQRPLHTKFFTTTLPFISKDNPKAKYTSLTEAPKDVQNHAALLNYLADPSKGKEIKDKLGKGTLKTLIVTKNNVGALALTQLNTEKKTYFDIADAATTHFEAVHIIQDGLTLYYMDAQLNKLAKVGEKLSDETWNKIARASFKTASLTEAQQNQYSVKYSPADITKAIKIATDWRKTILENTKSTPSLNYEFSITRGIANKMKNKDGSYAQNNVIDVIFNGGDINGQSVRVFPGVEGVINKEFVTLPAGRPFIYTTNGEHEQLHAADNNKLTAPQIATVQRVIQEMIADHIQKTLVLVNASKAISKSIKDKIANAGIDSLTPVEKKSLYLTLTKESKAKSLSLFNANYTNFLSSIVYFSRLDKKDSQGKLIAPSEKQIYIKGYQLVFGGKFGIDLTDPEGIATSPEIAEFLAPQYHNIRYFSSLEKSNVPYSEYFIDKDKSLKSRQWKTYAHYLLEDKLPDGSARDSVPVTTSIKTKAQHDAEENAGPYYQYASRAVTMETPEKEEKLPKKTEVKETSEAIQPSDEPGTIVDLDFTSERAVMMPGVKKSPVEQEALGKTEAKSVKDILAAKRGQTQVSEQMKAAPTKTVADILGKKRAPVEEAKPNQDIPDYNTNKQDLGPEDLLSLKGQFRVVGAGPFVSEQALGDTLEDIQRMLPQFPINRMDRMIRTSDGMEALGAFMDDAIYLSNLAGKETGYHEAFESVVNKLLSDKEWDAMHKEFTARNGYFTDRESGERIAYRNADEFQAKEQLAEEFMDYKLNNKTPVQPQTKSFFRIILDFIKNLFGARPTINEIFAKIDQGKLATRAVREENRFSSNYRRYLTDLKPEVKRDFMEYAAATLFSKVFYSPKSISQFDEIEETDESLYDLVKIDFQKRLDILNQSVAIEKDENNKAKYLKSITYYNYILGKWGDFVKANKEFIKKFSVKFQQEEQGENETPLSKEQEENKNQNDYQRDDFTVSQKLSASSVIKVLFGSLLNMRFDRNGSVTKVGNTITGTPDPILNSVYGASLADYDGFMLKALDAFKRLSNFTDIENKLKDLAGITELEQTSTPEEQAELVKTFSDEKAVWSYLYSKLFGKYDQIAEESQINLKIKFQNFVAKQAPRAFLYLLGGSSSSIIDANKRGFYESSVRKMESSFRQNVGMVFSKMSGKTSTWKSIIKSPINSGDFLANNSKKFNDFVQFLGLKDEVKQYLGTFNENTKEHKEARTLLTQKLLTIRNTLANKQVHGFTLGELGIYGYVDNLLKFLDNTLGISQKGTQHMNIDNEAQSNYVTSSLASRVISDMNNSSTLDELKAKFPQLDQVFSEDSIILQKMYDTEGNRTDFNIELGMIEGVKDGTENTGRKTSKLEEHDRYYQQFNTTLSGLYHTMVNDSESEWVFNFGEFVNYSENLLGERGDDIVKEFFLPKLLSEIKTAKEGNGGLEQLSAKHIGSEYEIGSSLRWFKDILSDKLTAKITKALNNKTSPKTAQRIITENRDAIIADIKAYLQAQVQAVTSKMDQESLTHTVDDIVTVKNLNTNFLQKYSSFFPKGQIENNFTKGQFESLVAYQKINSLLGHMEIFKLIFGDPAQYKDFDKRAKSFFSPVEQSYYDSTGEVNDWFNKNKNSAEFTDEEGNKTSVPLNNKDWFRKNFTNEITSRTVQDIFVVATDTLNSLIENSTGFSDKFRDNYAKINEADGQSIGTLGFTRELFMKSGWRWKDALEDYYQYDTALMRQELSQLDPKDKNYYSYKGNTALKSLDEKIVDKFNNNIPTFPLSPVKTLMMSVDENGKQIMLKHSIYSQSYQLAKGREMLDNYIQMLKDQVDVLNFKSVQKIGVQLDNAGEVTNYYNNPFEKNDLNSLGNPIFNLNYKTIGIQVETQGVSKQTLGTQLSKDIHLNLFEHGVPVDHLTPDMTTSERIENWLGLSHTQKLAASKNYEKVFGEKGTVRTLENLKTKNTIDTLTRMGIKWGMDNKGNVTFDFNNLTKVEQFIKDEIQRLAIDDNTLENISLNDDLTSFRNPAEALPTYARITNLLWALADKSSTSIKVNGKPFIQVASTFFNQGTRQAAYFDKTSNKWIVVDNKADYDTLTKEGKKLVMTSSELKFYSVNTEAGEINAMEILLPNIYKQKINEAREKKRLPVLTDEQILAHLEKNPKLLEGIGFRIPTQDTASLEFFKIKGFLPEAFGTAVVVPSAITMKAGSDFDVDKLNTYLNSWKLDKNGLPFYEEFKDDNNSTAQERYDITYGKKRKFFQKMEKYLQQKYEGEILNNKAKESVNKLFNEIFGNTDDVSYYTDEEMQDILDESIDYGNVTYAEFAKKVADEESRNISLAEFSKLPIALQNTKGALENRYFDSIRNILKSPEMFESLLSPITPDNVKQMRNTVYDAIGRKKDEDQQLDYTKQLSTEYLAEKRNQFISGKYYIGPFAVSMTNFANSQITGVGITNGGIKNKELYIFSTLNNGDISLPFKDVKMLNVFGHPFISISNLRTAEGNLVMNELSGYISGSTDVSKDPAIVEMGMHMELAPVYALLTRMGMKRSTIALFLYQPAVREYLRNLVLLDYKSDFGFTQYRFPNQIQEMLVGKYNPSGDVYDGEFKFDDDKLKHLIQKGEKVRVGTATFTAQENFEQYMALAAYLKAKMYATHLLETTQASNHDTAKIRNPWLLTKKDKELAKGIGHNMIARPTPTGGVQSGAQIIRDETFVNNDITLLKTFSNFFSKTGLFALQKDNPKQALDRIAESVISQSGFISDDDFTRSMREYETSMLNSLIAQVPIGEGNITLRKLDAQFFKTNAPNSIKKMFESLKSNPRYSKYFQDNFFLKNLEFNSDSETGIDLMRLKMTVSSDDVSTQEKMTEAMRSISTQPETMFPDLIQLYKAITYGAFRQFGMKYTRNSFLELIPSESLTEVTKNSLDNIDNEDFSNLKEDIARSQWWNKLIVQEVRPFSVHFAVPTADGKNYVLQNNSTWRSGKSNPPIRTSMTFFVKNVATVPGEIDFAPAINPIFHWGGYLGKETDWKDMPDFINIPGVKPEYLTVRLDRNDRPQRMLTQEAHDMIKAGNHSYMFFQLFKKVGVEDQSLARKMETKDSMLYMYKPVNKYGTRDFNGITPVNTTGSGTTYGDPSVIKNVPFIEIEDNELANKLSDNKGRILSLQDIPSKADRVVVKLGVKSKKQAKSQKKFERSSAIISRTIVRDNPKTLYIFGDNNTRSGLGGQAKEMRGEPNAFGISTKKLPSNEANAFMNDEELEQNKKVILGDIQKILQEWNTGKYDKVQLPPIGQGLAKLEEKAPHTWSYLQTQLNGLEKTVNSNQQKIEGDDVTNLPCA